MRGLVKGIPNYFQQNFTGTIINYAIDAGVKGRVIPIVFSPESLSDSVGASYTQTNIPGASAPQITYSSTGARKVSFSITLPLDYLPPNSAYTNFEDYLNSFRALVYPKYTSTGIIESPHCKLTTSNLEIDGVCDSCNIEYKTDRFANDGSMAANIGLSFIEVLDNVKDTDARWIANSKVNILKNTIVSTGNSRDNFIENSTVSNKDDGRCYVTMAGQSTYTITNFETGSLSQLISKGKFVDQGVSYTRQDKYTIKKLYGYIIDSDTATISDINVINNKYTAIINGKEQTLSTQVPNPDVWVNQCATYFIIYIPVYDGNKYETSSALVRKIIVYRKKV